MVWSLALFAVEKTLIHIETPFFFLIASLLAITVQAQTPSSLSTYLPAETSVKETLLSSPLMEMARSKKEFGTARAEMIDAGSAEFILRSNLQRRQDVLLGQQLHESVLSVERPIRFWGKRKIDADLSMQTQAFANIEYADAMHEGARELMHLWFSYLRALADKKNAESSFELTAKMHRLTQIQFKQGEISQLDEQLANAEFERVSAQRFVAEGQLQSASSAFASRYPGVTLPTSMPFDLLTPERMNSLSISEPLQAMREEFLEKNHELNMLRIDAKRLRLSAERVSKDRLPDPTLGVFTARERSGAEKISGLLFSVPLPGSAREFHAKASLAEAQSASDKVRLFERQLGAMFENMWFQFQNKKKAAENLRLAWQRQAVAAEKSLKAYTLGEGTLSQVLMISRLASENLNSAEHMSLEVVELLSLIRLDLHQIWDFDE